MPPVAEPQPALLLHPDDLRGYIDWFRDLGLYDLIAQQSDLQDEAIAAWAAAHLRQGTGTEQVRAPSPSRPAVQSAAAKPTVAPSTDLSPLQRAQRQRHAPTAGMPQPRTVAPSSSVSGLGPRIQITPPLTPPVPNLQAVAPAAALPDGIEAAQMPAPISFNQLAPMPAGRVAPADKAAALQALRESIGDCTRCPLAYAGRHSIVFADGDPNARLMFVGEGPGADEDEQGIPFVGKAGQLLNNMIGAMGLRRQDVYIANIVKCRPPKNRTPEPVEANTCSPFLLQQIDIVQPRVIVALGGTAATYVLGMKQSLASLRGQWFDVRGSRCAVTYHPAFLLRDPRQKGEAWKDLQRVMVALDLKPPART